MLNIGKFIVFEGMECSGKSTQVKKLSEYLTSRGIKNFVTREPGGTKSTQELREVILNHPYSAKSLALIFTADRHEHIISTIKPKLLDGFVVICDRYLFSTIVYQGLGGVAEELILDLHSKFNDNLMPDINIILDLAPELALKRLANRHDEKNIFDKKPLKYHNSIRNGFIELSEKYSKISTVIDASQQQEEVFQDILNALLDKKIIDKKSKASSKQAYKTLTSAHKALSV